jgi:hypothetical protein
MQGMIEQLMAPAQLGGQQDDVSGHFAEVMRDVFPSVESQLADVDAHMHALQESLSRMTPSELQACTDVHSPLALNLLLHVAQNVPMEEVGCLDHLKLCTLIARYMPACECNDTSARCASAVDVDMLCHETDGCNGVTFSRCSCTQQVLWFVCRQSLHMGKAPQKLLTLEH